MMSSQIAKTKKALTRGALVKGETKRIAIHDDSCGAELDAEGVCPVCKFIPDMQSIALVDSESDNLTQGALVKEENCIQMLKGKIEQMFPGVKASLDKPKLSNGVWWLDVYLDGHEVIVEWSPRGFGISARANPEEYGFGEGPDEVFEDPAAGEERVLNLLRHKLHTTVA